MKKLILTIIFFLLLAVAGFFAFSKPAAQTKTQCQQKEMIFYYLDECHWCNQMKNEGTIDAIQKMGIKITKINAAVGPIRHQFEGVPTVVINNQVYTGYRTLDEMKQLLGCP